MTVDNEDLICTLHNLENLKDESLDCDKTWDIAIDCVNKMIPNKIIRQFGGYCYCPSCNKDLSHSDKFMYCPDCGQALDWEE